MHDNHYDHAFEEFLREIRIPYVAVDEQRRALLQEASLKSMDFIVYSRTGANLLVDVKGRRFPSGGSEGSGHRWENWDTAEDLQCLQQWQEVFGTGFRALLVFAYDIVEPRELAAFERVFVFRQRHYAFFGVWADEYALRMRERSRSWQTVSLPSRDFHELRSPIESFL